MQKPKPAQPNLLARRPLKEAPRGRPQLSRNIQPSNQVVRNIGTLQRRWEFTTKPDQRLVESKVRMCNNRNLQALLKLARDSDLKVQTRAQLVIDNLKEQGEDLVATVDRAFRPLVDITKHEDPEIKTLAVWTLANLASYKGCQHQLMEEVGWHNIRTLYICSPVPEVRTATFVLLANLSCEPRNQQAIIEKGLPLLFTSLKEATTDEVRANVLQSLTIIAQVKEHGAAAIWETELLDIVIPYVLSCDHLELQNAAIGVLRSICSGVPSALILEKVFGQGVLETLLPLLGSNNPDVVADILLTLASISAVEVGFEAIESLGGVEAIAGLVESNTPAIQLAAVNAIATMAGKSYILVKFHQSREAMAAPLREVALMTRNGKTQQFAMQALALIDPNEAQFVEQSLKARRVSLITS